MTEWTLERIVNQLKRCHYECEGGPLENNEAFIALQEISKIDTSERCDQILPFLLQAYEDE